MCDDVLIGTLMTTYVYEYFSGQTRFYINGDYVYVVGSGQPAFWINGDYWYPYPSSGTPAFWVQGDYVYEHPISGPPKYYTPGKEPRHRRPSPRRGSGRIGWPRSAFAAG